MKKPEMAAPARAPLANNLIILTVRTPSENWVSPAAASANRMINTRGVLFFMISPFSNLLFQPFGDEPRTGMNIHLAQRTCSRVDEFVRGIRAGDHDLPRCGVNGGAIHGEGGLTFLNDKDLFIRM